MCVSRTGECETFATSNTEVMRKVSHSLPYLAGNKKGDVSIA
tara:strand:+ start:1044 stop:1169 length:126 start_codon:yes stop_codon:yes gene_type:complete